MLGQVGGDVGGSYAAAAAGGLAVGVKPGLMSVAVRVGLGGVRADGWVDGGDVVEDALPEVEDRLCAGVYVSSKQDVREGGQGSEGVEVGGDGVDGRCGELGIGGGGAGGQVGEAEVQVTMRPAVAAMRIERWVAWRRGRHWLVWGARSSRM